MFGHEIVIVKISGLTLIIPTLFPNPERLMMFNEAIRRVFLLSLESWTTDRKPVNTGKKFWVDNGSSANTNSSFYLIAKIQKTQRIDPASTRNPRSNIPNDRYKNAISNEAGFFKYFVEIDGERKLKHPISNYYTENNYLNQYGDLKFFYQE